MATQFYVPPWNAVINYKKYMMALESPALYYYATQDSVGQNPSGVYNFDVTSYSRSEDAVTMYFTHTGATLNFSRGSIVEITGVTANTSLNYTGMILDGGSGWVKYLNGGWDDGSSLSAGGLRCRNPYWTTGFFFTPSYATTLESKQSLIEVKYGDGYSQRQQAGINNNQFLWDANFNDRSDRETKAILNFVQDKGGVTAFPILIPLNRLINKPTLKYVAREARLGAAYYDLNNVAIKFEQVFEL